MDGLRRSVGTSRFGNFRPLRAPESRPPTPALTPARQPSRHALVAACGAAHGNVQRSAERKFSGSFLEVSCGCGGDPTGVRRGTQRGGHAYPRVLKGYRVTRLAVQHPRLPREPPDRCVRPVPLVHRHEGLRWDRASRPALAPRTSGAAATAAALALLCSHHEAAAEFRVPLRSPREKPGTHVKARTPWLSSRMPHRRAPEASRLRRRAMPRAADAARSGQLASAGAGRCGAGACMPKRHTVRSRRTALRTRSTWSGEQSPPPPPALSLPPPFLSVRIAVVSEGPSRTLCG
jgi:hypothetical protein